MSDCPLPEHLRLAAHWADAALASAHAAQLARVDARLQHAAGAQPAAGALHTAEAQPAAGVLHLAETLHSAEALHAAGRQLLGTEHAACHAHVTRDAAPQLARLAAYADALDRSLAQLEHAMSQAEAAVGLTLSARLARLLRPQQPGTPYLRQWPGPIPAPPNPREYL
ncbi:hypothetical protein H4S02_004337 [Coemansia sp. RSA 2611]|nr:hypothetical protein H4S02_004337 [Coemansia sp. RSA 2611]